MAKGLHSRSALEAHARGTFDGAQLPQSDRSGATCFIPKALSEQHHARRDETRPITLLSVSWKFIATFATTTFPEPYQPTLASGSVVS